MSALNAATKAPRTAEGAVASRITPLQELIRLTMATMLFEDNFYLDGKSAAGRIKELVHTVTLAEAAGVAIEARNQMKLRHVPLLIVRWLVATTYSPPVTVVAPSPLAAVRVSVTPATLATGYAPSRLA